MDSYFEKLNESITSKEKELKLLQSEKEKLCVKIEKLLDLHLQGQIETQSFHNYHQKPYERLQQLNQTIAEMEGELLGYSQREESTSLIVDETKNLYEKWETLDRDQKRNIIETITNTIVVGSQDIAINLYKILPDEYISSSLEKATNGHHNQWSVGHGPQQPFAHKYQLHRQNH